LVELLFREEWRVRRLAAEALEKIADPAATEALEVARELNLLLRRRLRTVE
jgi:HEAT repeat protein